MRNRFERQLLELNNELIQMGSMIERAIEMGISALVRQDVEKAKKAIAYDEEIDGQEKTVEVVALHEAAVAAAAGRKGSASDLRGIKDDYRYGADRRSCGGYFRDDDSDVRCGIRAQRDQY